MAKRGRGEGEPSEKPSVEVGKLIPQPHGGALLPGAGGGPQPGSGRPPDALRAAFRNDLEGARERVQEILARKGEPCSECGRGGRAGDATVISIFDKLAKYGIGERKTVSRDELVGIFGLMWDVVVAHNEVEDAPTRLRLIEDGWTKLNA